MPADQIIGRGNKTLVARRSAVDHTVQTFVTLSVKSVTLQCTHVKTCNLLQVCKRAVTCNKSVHKLSTSCVRTACSKFIVTGLKQVDKLDGIIRLVTRFFQQV